MRVITTAWFALLILLVVSSTASAENPTVHDTYSQVQTEMSMHLSELQDSLQARSINEWTDVEIEDYLNTSLWTIFSGIMLYQNVENCLPETMDDLVNSGYLQLVPLNPFNNWEPSVIRSNTTDFFAGDFCLQRCPSSVEDPSRHRSCELSVFGPTQEFAKYGYTEINRHNADWAVIPNGAVYQLGAAFKHATGKQTTANTEESGDKE